MDLLSKICRLCMQVHLQNVNLFSVECLLDFEDNLVDVIRKSTCVQIEPEDGLPQHVCTFCKQELLRMANFTMMIEKSDLAFRQSFNFKKFKSEVSEEIVKYESRKSGAPDYAVEQEVDIKPAQNTRNRVTYDEEDSNLMHVSDDPNEDSMLSLQVNIMPEQDTTNTIANDEEDSNLMYVSDEPNEDTYLSNEARLREELFNANRLITNLMRENFNHSLFQPLQNEQSTNSSRREWLDESVNTPVPALQDSEELHSLDKEFSNGLVCKCGKKFAKKRYLTAHFKRHNSVKTRCCTACGKRFQFIYELKKHLATHHNGKHYICEYCEIGFIYLDQLMEHRFKKHPESTMNPVVLLDKCK